MLKSVWIKVNNKQELKEVETFKKECNKRASDMTKMTKLMWRKQLEKWENE